MKGWVVVIHPFALPGSHFLTVVENIKQQPLSSGSVLHCQSSYSNNQQVFFDRDNCCLTKETKSHTKTFLKENAGVTSCSLSGGHINKLRGRTRHHQKQCMNKPVGKVQIFFVDLLWCTHASVVTSEWCHSISDQFQCFLDLKTW